jgi:hypothetical protein
MMRAEPRTSDLAVLAALAVEMPSRSRLVRRGRELDASVAK